MVYSHQNRNGGVSQSDSLSENQKPVDKHQSMKIWQTSLSGLWLVQWSPEKRNNSSKVTTHVSEASHFSHVCWRWHTADGFQLIRAWFNSVSTNHKTQIYVFCFYRKKQKLFFFFWNFSFRLSWLNRWKHCLKMSCVLFFRLPPPKLSSHAHTKSSRH